VHPLCLLCGLRIFQPQEEMTMLEKILQALSDLVTAINANTAALQSGETPKATRGRAAKAEAAQPAAAVSAAQAAPAAAVAAQTTSAPVQTVAGAAQPSADEVGKVFIRVANEISRDKAVEILKKYGAEVFAGVPPGSYAAFKADCEAALAAKAGPVASGAAGLI
jgi:hypothetical protein